MRQYNAPRVKESRGIQILTTVWLVPLIAMIIALWLGYQYYAKIGATIQISFRSNAGLVENQSLIKMRDVTIGMVTNISLSDNGKGVIIQARMNKEISNYLNEKARFWIVHPDVGSNGISGLDTIVSGSYIELFGKKEEETTHHYIGLEEPPLDDEARGVYYHLSAPKSYNISEGSHVYYRMMEVGRVERVGIAPDGGHVNFTIFVKDKYVPFINSQSKFYTRSAFNLDFSKGSLDMTLAPLSQLVHGGIAIHTPINTLEGNNTVKRGDVFYLYQSYAKVKSKHLGFGGEDKIYKITFNIPTKSLKIGAPIEFQGFQVGQITDIKSHYVAKTRKIKSEIYLMLHQDSFSNTKLKKLVKEGLKVKLATSLPVVGSQYLQLVFDKSYPATIKHEEGCDTLPVLNHRETSPDIMAQISSLLEKLEQLPLENLLLSVTNLVNENREPIGTLLSNMDRAVLDIDQTVLGAERSVNDLNVLTSQEEFINLPKTLENLIYNLDSTISSFNITVDNLNNFSSSQELHALPQNLNQAIFELENTLRNIQILSQEYGGDSKFADQLSVTLKAISEASESFDKTNKMLDRNANALVVGDE
jgi:paraquat-inducible protein B